MAANYDLNLQRGLALPSFDIVLWEDADFTVPLSGFMAGSISAAVKRIYTDAAIIFDLAPEQVSPNIVRFNAITAAKTILLSVGTTYRWDLLFKPSGADAYMLYKGKVNVEGVVSPIPA